MDSKQAELELSVIKKIMDDTRNISLNNGWHYIFWAAIVGAALIANYLMLITRTAMDYIGWMWLILMIGAWIFEAIIGRKREARQRVRTFAGKMLASLWLASGAVMFMFGFIGPISGAYNSIYICPIISTVIGVAFFISGEIQLLKWQKALSICWWLGAILLFMFPSVHTLLIFAIMLISLQAIPGIIMNRKFKKEMGSNMSVEV